MTPSGGADVVPKIPKDGFNMHKIGIPQHAVAATVGLGLALILVGCTEDADDITFVR